MKLIEIQKIVTRIISKYFGIDESEIKPTTMLVKDLHADNLDIYEIVMDLESAFNISIPHGIIKGDVSISALSRIVALILRRGNKRLEMKIDELDKLIEAKLQKLWLVEQEAEDRKKGHFVDIEKETLDNDNFREVLYTAENTQLVLMSIKPGEDIGGEVHHGIDQFFRIESGSGIAIINKNEYKITDGSSVIVPAGAKHNFVNTGKSDLKLYSLYSPPHHKDGTIHETKADAIQGEEEFDGKITEK